jgi:hypothetical protein
LSTQPKKIKIKLGITVLTLLILVNTVIVSHAKIPARGPVQSFVGPGGSEYKHQGVASWQKGKNHDQYFVYEPNNPKAQPNKLAVLIHDRMTTDPDYYMGQIEHLCKNGWLVLFPKYQGTNQKEEHYMFNVIRSIKDFMLEAFARTNADLTQANFAIIGLGTGATLAVNLAATADYFNLPKPRLIMPIMPEQGFLKLLALKGISRDARLLVITGDGASAPDAQLAIDIFYTANRVTTNNKALIYVTTDLYGQPPLVAHKLSALSPIKPEFERLVVTERNNFLNAHKDPRQAAYTRGHHIDAFDWYVTYRLFDLAAHLVFELNQDFKFLKKSKEVPAMGYWSDGRKVKPLKITDRP